MKLEYDKIKLSDGSSVIDIHLTDAKETITFHCTDHQAASKFIDGIGDLMEKFTIDILQVQ